MALRRIRECLYEEGYTIRGVQKLLNGRDETGMADGTDDVSARPTLFPLDPLPTGPTPLAEPSVARERRPTRTRLTVEMRAMLGEIRRELLEARALLHELVRPDAVR